MSYLDVSTLEADVAVNIRNFFAARFPIADDFSRARLRFSTRLGGNHRLLLTPGNRFAPMRTHLAYGTRTQPIHPLHFPIPIYYYTTRTLDR